MLVLSGVLILLSKFVAGNFSLPKQRKTKHSSNKQANVWRLWQIPCHVVVTQYGASSMRLSAAQSGFVIQ